MAVAFAYRSKATPLIEPRYPIMLTLAHAAAALALLVPLGPAREATTPIPDTAEASAQPDAAELPTAESLFEAHIAATGGMAAHQGHKNRVFDGIYRMLEENETQIIRVFMEAPNKFRAEIEAPGMGTTIRGFNGEVAWGLNLSGKPFLLQENRERAQIMDNAVFLGEAGYKERYSSIRTESLAKIDGRDAYRVVFKTPTGIEGAVYFDVESKLLVAREVAAENNPSLITTVTVGNYREFDGVLMPMLQRQKLATQSKPAVEIEFRWVNIDVDSLPSFDPPAGATYLSEG
ncbi:MAG: hypothetical protein ACF8LK_02165 [Phycisphaerales bacterium JB041]